MGNIPPNEDQKAKAEDAPLLDPIVDTLTDRRRCTCMIDFIFLFCLATVILVLVWRREFDGRVDKFTDWLAVYLPREIAFLRRVFL